MPEYQKIIINRSSDGRVASIALNDHETSNALSIQMIGELRTVLKTLSSEQDISVVQIQSTSKNFCSGGGLDWIKEIGREGSQLWSAGITELSGLYRDIYHFEIPLIAITKGSVVGAGVGLACLCDVVVSENNTKWLLPEVSLGLVPTIISPALYLKVPEMYMHQLLFWKKTWTASEMQQFGVVTENVNFDALEDKKIEIEKNYLSISPYIAKETKKLMRGFNERSFLSRLSAMTKMAIQTQNNKIEVSLIKNLLAKNNL